MRVEVTSDLSGVPQLVETHRPQIIVCDFQDTMQQKNMTSRSNCLVQKLVEQRLP